jgi:hypothetical protein
MSRFSAYDEDESRLPENMTRMGYDADTQRYQYQDTSDGSYWEGPPGSRYGVLRRVGADDDDDTSPADRLLAVEEGNRRLDAQEKEAWRYLLPFFLVCAVFLLLVFWWVGGYGFPFGGGGGVKCAEGAEVYTVRKGDTCWQIAKNHSVRLEDLMQLNKELLCEKLGIGKDICVPNAT